VAPPASVRLITPLGWSAEGDPGSSVRAREGREIADYERQLRRRLLCSSCWHVRPPQRSTADIR
jgi:hypothetical protein